MTKGKALPEIVSEIYGLLEPLESQDRQKVIGSAMTLLGDQNASSPKFNENPGGGGGSGGGSGSTGGGGGGGGDSTFGVRATRWTKQNDISVAMIEEIFHGDGEDVEVIASEVPGNGKRGKTHNCYLLSGIRALLANDEAKFSDDEAVALCKEMGCYDGSNHAKNRSDLGNIVAGSKGGGYTLPAPGLRAAAAVVKSMAGSE